MTHVTCRLTAKNRDQLRIPMLGGRVWAYCIHIVCCGWLCAERQDAVAELESTFAVIKSRAENRQSGLE